MPFRFNPFTGNLDEVDTTAAAGSDSQVQVNDGGSLAGFIELLWNKVTKVFTVKGDINLDDGVAGFTVTRQQVTASAARTQLFPNATGVVPVFSGPTAAAAWAAVDGGFYGALPFNNGGGTLAYSNALGFNPATGTLSVLLLNAGTTTLGATTTGTLSSTSGTFSGRVICSVANAASAPAGSFTGTWFQTGTSTTTKPALLVEQSTATSTGWCAKGTGFGVNSTAAFVGRLVDWQQNGVSRWFITTAGVVVGTQPAPAAVDATDTLTAANILSGIVTSTTAAAVDMTLPTGTDMDTGFADPGTFNNMAVEWSVINTGSNAATLIANTDHTIVGAAAVAAGTSGRFTTRRTAANTYVTYRLS